MNTELHVISNGRQSFQQIAEIAAEIVEYIDYFHIRERAKSTKELYDGIRLLTEAGVPVSKLVMNDRIDIALLTGISRVQLGYQSAPAHAVKAKLPQLHIGCSVHSLAEAACRQQEGADSVMYGHVFATRSKEGVPPRGIEELQQITKALTIPVIAIGGILPSCIEEMVSTEVSGVAVMSSIWETKDPLLQVKAYWEQMRGWGKYSE